MTGGEPAARCFRCGAPATETFGNNYLCENCRPDGDGVPADDGDRDAGNGWDGADFAAPEPGVWPAELLDREQWMGHVDKKPFAPWGDRDHPEADADEDARWKWGLQEHYVDGATVALAEDDPRLDGRAFLQWPDDPYAYVDGDDVRDPETGAVHPGFVDVLEALGLTYADVSQSGAGVHAVYRGDLPEDVKQAAWQLDDEPFGGNDDRPSVEIYPGKRVCVMTGDHVPGTPTEVREWDADGLEAVLDEHGQLPEPEPDRPAAAFDDFDSTDYEPVATSASETTDEIRDLFAAIDALDAQRVAATTIVHAWNDDASTSEGERAFVPTWGPNSRGTANIVNSDRWQDTGDRGGYGGPVCMAAIDAGLVDDRQCPDAVRGATWFRAVDHLRSLGFDVPEYDPESGDDHTPRVVECPPPADDPAPIDVDAVREQLRGPIYDAFVEHDDAPTVLAHDPGAGKTTTSHLAAADRDRPLAFLFDKHAKAHEHRADEVTPDVDLHLRGAAQPREDACARAAYEGEACPEHGDPSACPRMCPLYDRPEGHADREAFDALAAEVGPVRAHLILEPHDGDGCAWLDTFDDLDGADAVAGVHEYQRLKTVRSAGDGPRDVIVDESPGVLADDRRLDVPDLVRLANTLEDWSGRDRVGETLRRVGRFARDVADAVVEGAALDAIEPPTPVVDAYESHDPAAGNYMAYVEPDDPATDRSVEALARARRAFLDHHLAAIRDPDREWDGTPLAFDALLGAAAAAGLDEDLARTVAGRPLDLDRCPVCSSELEYGGGGRHCGACAWSEQDGALTAGAPTPARLLAWIDADPRDPDTPPALVRRRLPRVEDLPDDPLVLDATATPERIAALYGADQDDVRVVGAEQHALPGAHVTQILDGQYHGSTLRAAVEEDRATARRIQARLDRAGVVYDRPLVVGRQDTPDLFDLPDNARFIHFHAARGLNFQECDAVLVVGAPHPNVEDLRREARLLAQGRDDLRVGGVEHSTRAAAKEPVYRKLRYTDDEGQGRAVATKHYTGLVGALFREAREKELEQVVHRVRPLLADADDLVDVELLTNVLTALPVDEVCSLEELAETPAAMLPVCEGALALAGTLADVAAGEGPDGFRAAALVDRDGEGGVRFRIREVHRLARVAGHDVAERTVRRWIDDLQELGLVDAGDYLAREGVPYSADGATLTRALSVLTSNADVEVAIKRRLAALARELDSAAAWLRRASTLVDLRADPSVATPALNGGDRPPDDAD